MAKSRKQAALAIAAAQPPKWAPPKTAPARVDSPTVPGAVEHLTRAVSTVDAMHQRRQLSDAQHRAAQKCCNAYEVLYGAAGGAMDYDRARGSGPPGKTPHLAALLAADTMAEAREALYDDDHVIIMLVVCQGLSIEETALRLFGADERAHKEEAGRRLRVALTELAKLWYGGDVQSRRSSPIAVKPWTAPGAKHCPGEERTVPKGRAAHATSDRIYHTGA
jgi:hypothetical protein